MLLSDFPREILERFTDFLSLKEKASCSLVCKSWKEIFQYSMHYAIEIKSAKTLEDILTPYNDSRHNYYETGHLAKYLYLAYFLRITDEELYTLQNIFPNIKQIHCEVNSISTTNFGITADWHLWKSLTEFYIHLNYSSVFNMKNKIVKVILCLPFLRRLEIHNTLWGNSTTPFSLNDFETIHSHLKHLGHLELDTNLLTLPETDLERIIKVPPATKMGILKITSEKTDHRWLCYFAHKYPNLHTLGLYIEGIIPDPKEQRSRTTALFQQTPRPFQRLTKLNLEYINCVENEYLLFWDIINFHNMPLKHIWVRINLYSSYLSANPCTIPKTVTEICLPNFSKTIQSFQLECLEANTVPIDLMKLNDSLYNLVKLDIKAPAYVEIDTLLYAAPSLKELLLHYSQIQVKNEFYNPKRFRLQSLKVYDSKTSSDVLRFLSFHCRSLTVLALNNSSVYGNITIHGCQFIDMAYSRLEKLYIYDTEFIIKTNKECYDNWNIVLITRPIDDIPPKQDYNPNLLPTGIGGRPIDFYYTWFYTYKTQDMRALSNVQVSRITKFFSSYEENKKITVKRALCTKSKRPTARLKNSCVSGYTKIKLGYVVDSLITYYTHFK